VADANSVLETPLTVKIPEGFAFYALYPEQYCLAALRWLADHNSASPRRVAVVGIRTIGTTLSAVVSAVLAAAGWEVRRLTVRPSGHPYSRQVEIAREEVGEAAWALVVDEGPGQSGSSMAATAGALAACGIDPSHISFLPSHDAGPSGAAPDDSRAWWSHTRCYAVPLRELRWEGKPLTEALAARTVELFPESGPVQEVRDMAGGLWREVVYPDVDQWPAVDGPFERTKYRCTLRDGTAVLWKFAGQVSAPSGPGSADQQAMERLTGRAEGGWTAAPLGTALGFVALPWLEGTPLAPEGADPVVLDHIGRYLVHVAGPPLTGAEREAARTRLREMLYWNTWEALGEETSSRTRVWGERALELEGEAPLLSYGDGRMAPHEWLRLPCGRLLKTDGTGHEWDHTAVGRQPLAWDVAGALVEWGLDGEAALPLLTAVEQAGGPTYPADLLSFYRMAYAAFWVGMTALCAQMCPHYPEEQERLWRAHARYREELATRLVGA